MKKITRLLIANRGEIAVRVIRACRDKAIASIAIYSDQDRDAVHTQLADEAYCLEGETAAETYLNIEKILDIAKLSRADGIHPGYGFLAESPEFAEAVSSAGITWVGPRAGVIALLADKLSARKIAEQVGVPVPPGGEHVVSCASEVHNFADKYGLPIAIKAAYGGGGLGMKVVKQKKNIDELFASAQREAQAAFGNKECFIEKYIDRPRHVETQCLADLFGNVQVVSTRDCSVQRRHQKLIEEAPAYTLTDKQEETLITASKAVMKAAEYSGAGTCEFLIDQDGKIFFLEVNARLQVEHPVTEEITGIDLVLEQINIAEGKLLKNLETPVYKGHSLEFRINAEDANSGFMPRHGKVVKFEPPGGLGIRIDSGIKAGDTIGAAFDSLLCKLIVTGNNRECALARARRALDEFVIDGVTTLIPFHRNILNQPDFINGGMYTGWVENEYSKLVNKQTDASTVPDIQDTLSVSKNLREIIVEVNRKQIRVRLPSPIGEYPTERQKPPGRRVGHNFRQKTQEKNPDSIFSPMQAVVVKVNVTEGQSVKKDDLLIVLEAMKMEQPIVAPRDGVVEKINAHTGETVPSGHELLRLKKV
ncbi:acetyl/propionyl/methylcrotonyl-CoA carboxylase subunit alpha [Tropheryma whipplei]|uniref:biotin carboxylase n=1 Tax=Tropheryma whipplei (strain Twist) TaxID=203267 RepID=Q83H42_TROWT|nr:biotin carboxylase N-terminal domain-containing protein [Tropheryma whipplei]AAO44117.1 biotin carboxylase [Tropheryma whipplei str. Twist]CAD66712.1 putative acyl-CoA carboxylase complex A subunit [Tropheryma whipplei TW08/27]